MNGKKCQKCCHVANVKCWPLREASFDKENVYIDLEYPRTPERQSIIEVGLMDVRAADNIQISYDFERDGWVIKQDAFEEIPCGSESLDDWQEVAFIRACAREVENE